MWSRRIPSRISLVLIAWRWARRNYGIPCNKRWHKCQRHIFEGGQRPGATRLAEIKTIKTRKRDLFTDPRRNPKKWSESNPKVINIQAKVIDTIVDNNYNPILKKGIYFIGTKHSIYKDLVFPKGSIIIDPFRYIKPKNDCKVISVGNNSLC